MEHKLKLSKKQVEALTAIQVQKNDALKVFNEVSTRERLLLDMIFDFNQFVETTEKIVLEGDSLIVTVADKKPKPKKESEPLKVNQ